MEPHRVYNTTHRRDQLHISTASHLTSPPSSTVQQKNYQIAVQPHTSHVFTSQIRRMNKVSSLLFGAALLCSVLSSANGLNCFAKWCSYEYTGYACEDVAFNGACSKYSKTPESAPFCAQYWGSAPSNTIIFLGGNWYRAVKKGNGKNGKSNKCSNRKDIGDGSCHWIGSNGADVYRC